MNLSKNRFSHEAKFFYHQSERYFTKGASFLAICHQSERYVPNGTRFLVTKGARFLAICNQSERYFPNGARFLASVNNQLLDWLFATFDCHHNYKKYFVRNFWTSDQEFFSLTKEKSHQSLIQVIINFFFKWMSSVRFSELCLL